MNHSVTHKDALSLKKLTGQNAVIVEKKSEELEDSKFDLGGYRKSVSVSKTNSSEQRTRQPPIKSLMPSGKSHGARPGETPEIPH